MNPAVRLTAKGLAGDAGCGKRIALSICDGCGLQSCRGVTDKMIMTPLTIAVAALQIVASWVLSVLAILAVFVSLIACLAFLELVLERGALARAYTVKVNSLDIDGPSSRD